MSIEKQLKQTRVYHNVAANRIIELYDLSQSALADETRRLEFRVRYENLEAVYEEFNEKHVALLAILAVHLDTELDAAEEKRKNIDNKFYAIKANYRKLFPTQDDATNDAIAARHSNMKLRKLELPKFDGNFKNWSTFISLYNGSIHSNQNLTDAEKFEYLLTALSGEPLSMINNITLNDANYSIAYNNLVQHYQDECMLVTYYFEEIINAPKMVGDSPKALKKLLIIFKNNLLALENLKYTLDKFSNFILFHKLCEKVDQETLTRFEVKHASKKMPTYEALYDFLESECSAINRVTLTQNKHSKSPNKTMVNKPLSYKSNTSVASSFVANTNNTGVNATLCRLLPSVSVPTVLLATALIEVLDGKGNYQETAQVRRVLLGLSRSKISLSVNGIGHMSSTASSRVSCTIRPRGQCDFSLPIDLVILQKICTDMPRHRIFYENWAHIRNLNLADPSFFLSAPIDILLGADVFPLILVNGCLKGRPSEPLAINTRFGWVLMGKVDSSAPSINSFCTAYELSDDTLKRFWQIEEVPLREVPSPEDALCEKLFLETHTRDATGRYCATLPFRDNEPYLPGS
ncbi:hypothetical protein NQ315_016085, partial [Exocentrus adspersus]